MMKPDNLLNELGALAREQQDASLPPELEAPLGEDFEKRMLATLAPEEEAARTPVQPPPLRRGAVWAKRARALVPLAMAAVIVLVVLPRDRATPAIPLYELEASGAVAKDRSSPGEAGEQGPLELTGDTELELVFRPNAPAGVAMAAKLFLVRDTGRTSLDVIPERSDEGAFRFVIPAAQLLETRGVAELWAWVGPAEEAARVPPGSIPEGGQTFRRELRRR